MKCKIVCILVALSGLVMAEHNYSTEVGTNSVQIVAGGNKNTLPITNGQALTQGQLVSYGGTAYFVTAPATITSLPGHTSGQSSSNGPTLRVTPSYIGVSDKREVVFVDNVGTNQMWITIGNGPAVVGTGVRLEQGDRAWFNTYLAVHAISATGTTTVATQEIY